MSVITFGTVNIREISRTKLRPKVGAADVVVFVEFGGLTVQGDRPCFQNVRVFGKAQRELGILLHQHDGHAPLVNLRDESADLLDEDRRESDRRLVQQKNLRTRHQRSADRKHLLLAAGEGLGPLTTPLLEPRKMFKYFGQIFRDRCLVAA